MLQQPSSRGLTLTYSSMTWNSCSERLTTSRSALSVPYFSSAGWGRSRAANASASSFACSSKSYKQHITSTPSSQWSGSMSSRVGYRGAGYGMFQQVLHANTGLAPGLKCSWLLGGAAAALEKRPAQLLPASAPAGQPANFICCKDRQ